LFTFGYEEAFETNVECSTNIQQTWKRVSTAPAERFTARGLVDGRIQKVVSFHGYE